ncbi:MAG: hypothetical protein QW123_00730 [Desulfurococcaceae archaeon]
MQKRPLVIAIYEPRWFMKVLEVARRRNLLFYHYYSPQEVPYGSVVYTDYEPIARELVIRSDVEVVYDPVRSCRVFEKAIMTSSLKEKYDSVVVGVDPGLLPSYVVVGDHELLLYGEGIKSLVKDIEYVLNCVHFDKITIRVGTGPRSGDIIVYLKNRYKVPIELVNEFCTTPSSNRINEVTYLSKRLKGVKPFRYKDVYAAYRIALTSGIEVL